MVHSNGADTHMQACTRTHTHIHTHTYIHFRSGAFSSLLPVALSSKQSRATGELHGVAGPKNMDLGLLHICWCKNPVLSGKDTIEVTLIHPVSTRSFSITNVQSWWYESIIVYVVNYSSLEIKFRIWLRKWLRFVLIDNCFLLWKLVEKKML